MKVLINGTQEEQMNEYYKDLFKKHIKPRIHGFQQIIIEKLYNDCPHCYMPVRYDRVVCDCCNKEL